MLSGALQTQLLGLVPNTESFTDFVEDDPIVYQVTLSLSCNWNQVMTSPLYQQIYQVVEQIPPGKVATYGQIAEQLGLFGRARQVGYALYRVPLDSTIPWHRVINAQGKISRSPLRQGSDELQRQLLIAEGIAFSHTDQIDLKQYRWQPED